MTSRMVFDLAATDAARSTEPLGDHAGLTALLRDAWSYGLASGLIRPTPTSSSTTAPGLRGLSAVVEPKPTRTS